MAFCQKIQNLRFSSFQNFLKEKGRGESEGGSFFGCGQAVSPDEHPETGQVGSVTLSLTKYIYIYIWKVR